MEIAEVIDRYVTEHPRAADTLRGVHGWWMAGHRAGASPAEVKRALDLLVGRGRLVRIDLPDGTAIYSRPAASEAERSQ